MSSGMAASAEVIHSFSTKDGNFDDIARHNVISTAGVDREGRQVVVFFACRLPDKNQIDHDRLLLYTIHTLSTIVESDYSLVYFHHGLNSANKPGVRWAIKMYRALDRNYKKNIKKMIIVHPTAFIRVLLTAFKPIVSAKFGRKLSQMSRLAELEPLLYTSQLDIPAAICEYDSSLPGVGGRGGEPSWYTDESRRGNTATSNVQVFGLAPSVLAERNGGDAVVPMLRLCAAHIREHGMSTVGVFRRSAKSVDLHAAKQAFDSGSGVSLDSYDVHLAACLIKLFFRELPEPLLTYDLYTPITTPGPKFTMSEKLPEMTELLKTIPGANRQLLFFLLPFLVEVARHHETNLMTEFNMSRVFGPNMIWSNQAAANLETMDSINDFMLGMLENHPHLCSALQPS